MAEDVRVRMTLDSSNFNSGMSQAQSKMSSFKGKMKEVGSGLQNVGKVMTATGVGMIGAVGGIVAKGAEWSASVESVNFLYGNLDKSVQKAIQSNMANAKSLGMTEQQYKSNATSLATFLSNMGFTNEEIANMSEKSMNLAADLGALADVPVDQAMGDFKSALMGNYEALDKYGVNISAATLENSEYVQSLGKSWNQLSDNEKMMAVYNEVMRQSASAQGLAKQEAGSFSSQMKLLKESIGETVGQLGDALLPVLEPIVAKIQEVVQNVSKWIQENPKLAQAILIVVGSLGALLAIAGPIVMAIGMASVAMAGFSMASLPVIGTIAAIVAGITLLVAAIALIAFNWDSIKAKTIEVWNNIKTFCMNTWNSLKASASSIWNGIKTGIVNIVQGIVNGIKNYLNNVKAFWSSVWNAIKAVASSVWNGIKSVISSVCNGIKSVITSIFNGVKSFITNVFNGIKSIASNIWNGIKSVIKGACDGVKSTVSNIFNGLKNTVKGALDGVYNTAKGIWDKVTGIFSKPIKAVVNFVKGGKMAMPSPQSYSPIGATSGFAPMSLARASVVPSLGASGGAPVSFSANMNTNVQLDGKTIAKASAPYMKTEIDKINKRQNRLGGR